MISDATAWRLNSTDEMLHQAAARLGSSRIVQILWRFPTPLAADALQAEWDQLNQGLLSRRATGARIPVARRKWLTADNAEPLHLERRSLTEATAPDWIDTQVRAPLPADSRALWRLAAAPYRGGCLVSLTVPHFRSDGLGIVNAIAARHAPRHRGDGVPDSDLADALRQLARTVPQVARWGIRLLGDRQERTALTNAVRRHPDPHTASGSTPQFFTSAIYEVDARRWQEQAQAHGGTVNSLFVEVAANLIRERVPRAANATIDVGIPMSLRHPTHDERANALVVVPLTVPGGTPRHGDLRATRQATKALLQSSGRHSTTRVPEPLWHLLPARYAEPLKNPGAQQVDVVASNFGVAPDELAILAGRKADSIALRTMNVPGLVPERARLRASLCLLRTGDQLTVTVTGMPAPYGDNASLHSLVTDEFTAWGLTARPWWNAPAPDMKKG
ncbi:hypothetical protein [Streptomyces sp. NPDC051561]|uniref:hypothetical protein n=1 Tax=Streptomyces sp. NPDC051561 TaxID=3365658 RepID=UPI00379140A3